MKSFILLLFLFFFISSFSQIPTNGLIRDYSFSGNANDSSGNNYHGTVTNAQLTVDRYNNPNSAYSFNGTSAYIDIPFDGLDLNEYTYSVWANTATLPSIGTGTIVLAVGTAFTDQVINTNNSVGVNQGWGGNGYNLSGPAQYIAYNGESLVTNKWVHIVMVRESNKLRCYIDCKLEKTDSTSQSHLPSYGFSPFAKIGARQNNATKFNGKIDDLRIYNRALTYDEIVMLCEDKATSISSNVEKETLTIFPNPAKNDLNILNNNPIKINSIEILNALGVIQIKNEVINNANFSIDIQNLSSGIYYVVAYLQNGEKSIQKLSIIK